MNYFSFLLYICFIFFIFLSSSLLAQFKIDGQIIQRAEYLDGYGSPAKVALQPAFFIGQRSRINLEYKEDKVLFYISPQDVRTWGSTPQLNLTDGYFSLHQAWTEILLNKKFSTKIGRQELVYDDSRFLGNVDWALQARSHDIALLKYGDSTTSIHAGAAYNQDKSAQLQGNIYTVPGQYKTAQFLWINKEINKIKVSAILWNNGMQFSGLWYDSSKRENIRYMQTFGLPKIEIPIRSLTLNAFYYHQLGADAANKSVNAFDACLEASYLIKLNADKKSQIRFSLGSEYLSGTSQTDTSYKYNNSFNPLFGTNHRFNGYMDYFYVGIRHTNSVGLSDTYFKVRYDLSHKLFVSVNAHLFQATADVRDMKKTEIIPLNPYLGTETDFTAGYIIGNSVSLQFGYSYFNSSETMESIRGTAQNHNHWTYLMLLVRPGFREKFTGLKF